MGTAHEGGKLDKPAGWLNRTVLGIGLASLCSDSGHEIATTSLPALLASVGASTAALGLIEGLTDGASSFAKLLSGLYSDRLCRRKPLAVAGYFLTASGMAVMALTTAWWQVLLGRMFGWIGRGARTPVRNVLLTEAATPATYGRAFGFERAMDSAGAVLGPLLALLLVTEIGLRPTFVFTLIPGCAAALLIWLLVAERKHVPQPHIHLWSGMKGFPREYKRFLLGVGLAGLGNFSNTMLILWATAAFAPIVGTERSVVLAMAYYAGYNVVYTLSCYAYGWLADRFSKSRVLAVGYALAVIPAAALLLPGNPFVVFAIVFGTSGLYMGAWETVEGTSAAGILPAAIRGAGFGALATVNGIGDLVSSIAVGFLWTASPTLAMGYVIVTTTIGAVVVAGIRAEKES